MNIKHLDETLATPKDLADKNIMSLAYQWRQRKKGKLKFYQVGRKILYSEKHLQDFFASCEQNSEQK
jgi:hypothetical protein